MTFKHSPSTIYSKKTGDKFHFVSTNTLFVYCEDKSGNNGVIYFTPLQVTKENLENMIPNIKSTLEGNFSDYQLKLVGNEDLMTQFLKLTAFSEKQVISRSIRHGEFEVLYIPESSTLKVTKEQLKKQEVENKKIRALIVDDSKTIRTLLNKILSSDKNIEVVAMAEHPNMVEDLIKKHSPDVLTLDIHMPEMNGVQLLKKIMPKYSIPTVMISSISLEEGPMVLEALENGAVDYIQKPSADQITTVAPLIIEKIKIASCSKTRPKTTQNRPQAKLKSSGPMDTTKLIVIGSSTGGTEALKSVLTRLPDNIPPILIVQHIPAVFSLAFANRIDGLCNFLVKEAEDGDEVTPNKVIIAAGGTQMGVRKVGEKLKIVVNDDPPMNRHKPSVDYMFQSVSKSFQGDIISVILTGMGADGAREMLTLKNQGAVTIAQDEESSVVFGMPREAIKNGAADHIVSLNDIPEKILEFLETPPLKKAN
jgi:two-component system, chemotaxis family, protein-glutamate methylesterase/glutaminase